MSEWFDDVLAGMVARGEMRIETVNGTPTYRQTAKGAELARESLRQTARVERFYMTKIASLQKPDLLEEMADCLQREHRLLAQAQLEHVRVMAIYRRLSSEAQAIAEQTWSEPT